MRDKTNRTDAEWKEILSTEQYDVLRKKGTERPGTGTYLHNKKKGTYTCAGCGKELFESDEKYESGCGWPSFYKTSYDDSIAEQSDKSHGMTRTEVLCSNCGGHLGHVFNDGPEPTGIRYCINSLSLNFKESAKDDKPLEKATFGAGCFWCTEAAFESIKGVKSVTVGYMGGKKEDPTYKEVCTGKTGHAEVSQVTYDPDEVSYADILEVFWKVHDPTTLNRQGADIGTQYRSVIFYHSEEQKKAAEKSMAEYDGKLKDRIVTEISAASTFYKAEDYHQNYYENNKEQPYCRRIIAPKLKKLKK